MNRLECCKKFELAGSVFSGEPEVLTRRNILYVPRSKGGSDSDFGLYDETGRQLLGSALFAKYPSALKSQKASTSLKYTPYRARIPSAIYGGIISSHFGHLITELFNTLWFYSQYGAPTDLLLFHSHINLDDIFSTPWLSDLLRYAGVRRDQILIPRQPVVVDRLVVPGQAFSEDSFVYSSYATQAATIGDVALEDCVVPPEGPVYLSRSHLRSGTWQLVNEPALEDALSSYGVRIVAPETLRVCEQIAIFANCPVLGPVGSAFHCSIFARRPRGIALSPRQEVYRSYPLMDAAHDARIDYLYDPNITAVRSSSGFIDAFELRDPQATASALMRQLELQNQQGEYVEPQVSSKTAVTGNTGSSFSIRTSPLSATSTASRSNRSKIWHLETKDAVPIIVDTASEIISARSTKNAWGVKCIIVVEGNRAFLMALHPDLPCLKIADETHYGPVLSYYVERHDDFIALRHPITGMWLKAPPPRLGLGLFADGEAVKDWELFQFGSLEVDTDGGRLGQLLAAINEFGVTGSSHQATSIFPAIGPALSRFGSPKLPLPLSS